MSLTVWFLAGLLTFEPSPLPSASPTAQASNLPTMPAGWVSAPFATSVEYAHYIRHEQDGTVSELSADSQVCNCDPDHAMGMLQGVFESIKGASVQLSSIVACGKQGDRLLVTGLDTSKGRKNIEAVMFRDEPALVTLMYSFPYSKPLPDAEAALMSLCPTSASH